jgi:hypothetical protein
VSWPGRLDGSSRSSSWYLARPLLQWWDSIDLAGRRSKHLSDFAAQRFDYVISLCDPVREVFPEFPGGPELIH